MVSSDFEGANAGDWSVNESTYPIEVRVGPGSSEHIWYFRISGVRDKTIRFVTDLNRFMRGDQLKQGIAYSYDNKRWQNVDNQDDGTQVIRFTGDVAYISLQSIVTNTTLEQWYQDLPDLEHIQRRHLGITDGQTGEFYWDREPLPVEPKAYDHGFPLWLYTISDTSKSTEPTRNILIMARECGWETQSTIGSLAIMEWLLSEDPLARRAREMAVWHFIPIANVDCVAAGLETSMKLTWFNPDDPEYVSPYEEAGFIKDFIIEAGQYNTERDFEARRWITFEDHKLHGIAFGRYITRLLEVEL